MAISESLIATLDAHTYKPRLSSTPAKLIVATLSHYILQFTMREIRGQFQNQPPIGRLKKYKIENKTLLYGTVTYITALLLHIVTIHI